MRGKSEMSERTASIIEFSRPKELIECVDSLYREFRESFSEKT